LGKALADKSKFYFQASAVGDVEQDMSVITFSSSSSDSDDNDGKIDVKTLLYHDDIKLDAKTSSDSDDNDVSVDVKRAARKPSGISTEETYL
jgi:hypothetical protein